MFVSEERDNLPKIGRALGRSPGARPIFGFSPLPLKGGGEGGGGVRINHRITQPMEGRL